MRTLTKRFYSMSDKRLRNAQKGKNSVLHCDYDDRGKAWIINTVIRSSVYRMLLTVQEIRVATLLKVMWSFTKNEH